MKELTTIVVFLALMAYAVAAPVNKNEKTNLAIQGYDPVAFFTNSKATKGSDQITHAHESAIYQFSTIEHRDAFVKDPSAYLPAYGGYCAYGASKGALYDVEIDTWSIVDGRLILQYNQSIKKKFDKNLDEGLAKADAYWATLK